MNPLRLIAARWRALFRKETLDREMDEEMQFHLDMQTEENVRSGMEPVAARQAALRAFGGLDQIREVRRDLRGVRWIETLFQDLRYGARVLSRAPGFMTAAVAMLALGIGLNVAAFGFLNLLVFKPLPVRDPETLLRFKRRAPQNYAWMLPYPEMAFFREHSRTLAAVLAIGDGRLALDGAERRIESQFVTANFFQELGASPALGRLLDPGRDEADGAEPGVVLSHEFWRSQFGGDPAVLGRPLRLNGQSVQVVGVAAETFSGLTLEKPAMWLALRQQPYLVAGSRLLTDFSAESPGVRMFGRLAPGCSPKAAEDELRLLAAELHRQHPADIWEDETLRSEPGAFARGAGGSRRGTGTESGDPLYPVAALVGTLVFLILAVACANLGSLLLARGLAREREIGIRIAIGASRARIIRQLFTESLLLAFLGSLAGLAVGYPVLRGLLRLADAPAWLSPLPDLRVVAFAVGMGFVAAVLFGLAPAFQVAQQRHRTSFIRHLLVGAQVASSCVLLIIAGLLARALGHALSASPGFDYQQVVAIDPGLAGHGHSPAAARTYLDTLQSRLQGLPGVESVSLASVTPLGQKQVTVGTEVDGRPLNIHIHAVDPHFFQTMRIPLLRGRNLAAGDSRGLVISESLARRAWPNQDPLGQPLRLRSPEDTVVGIVGSARLVALQDSDALEAYVLAGDSDVTSLVTLVRASGPPEGLLPFLGSLARSVDPSVIPELELLKTSFTRKLKPVEYSAAAVSGLSLLALAIACLGILGLVTYAVSQRAKELAIRSALGARSAHILTSVFRPLVLPVLVGLLLGLGTAAAGSRILRQTLFGISNLDPLAYTGAIAVFLIAVALAAIGPARRALTIDPMRALRHD